jgi:hypothetical protein
MRLIYTTRGRDTFRILLSRKQSKKSMLSEPASGVHSMYSCPTISPRTDSRYDANDLPSLQRRVCILCTHQRRPLASFTCAACPSLSAAHEASRLQVLFPLLSLHALNAESLTHAHTQTRPFRSILSPTIASGTDALDEAITKMLTADVGTFATPDAYDQYAGYRANSPSQSPHVMVPSGDFHSFFPTDMERCTHDTHADMLACNVMYRPPPLLPTCVCISHMSHCGLLVGSIMMGLEPSKAPRGIQLAGLPKVYTQA